MWQTKVIQRFWFQVFALEDDKGVCLQERAWSTTSYVALFFCPSPEKKNESVVHLTLGLNADERNGLSFPASNWPVNSPHERAAGNNVNLKMKGWISLPYTIYLFFFVMKGEPGHGGYLFWIDVFRWYLYLSHARKIKRSPSFMWHFSPPA